MYQRGMTVSHNEVSVSVGVDGKIMLSVRMNSRLSVSEHNFIVDSINAHAWDNIKIVIGAQILPKHIYQILKKAVIAIDCIEDQYDADVARFYVVHAGKKISGPNIIEIKT